MIFTQYFEKEKIIASTPSDSPPRPAPVCDCYEDVVSRNKILVISVLDLIYWSQVMNIYRCLCLCLFTQYMPANRKISIRIPYISADIMCILLLILYKYTIYAIPALYRSICVFQNVYICDWQCPVVNQVFLSPLIL